MEFAVAHVPGAIHIALTGQYASWAARLLGLDEARTRTAIALGLLRAGGLRAAFGSDAKALQVGLAAAGGVQAARLAAAGARVDTAAIVAGRGGFAEAFGVAARPATLEAMLAAHGAIDENWIKAYPCCLQTHGAIDAALLAGGPPPRDSVIVVTVHPISRQAAALDGVRDTLEAKFSIPYLTAYALLHGAPGLDAFDDLYVDAAALGARIAVRTDAALGADEARLAFDGEVVARVKRPRGCPPDVLDAGARAAKVAALAGDALAGALEDDVAPAAGLLI
jgi:2-methylcitrate dehydratase PrpD